MSFISVGFKKGDFRETINWLNAKPAQVERAERRAVGKMLRFSGGFVARTVAIATAIPTTLLTKGGGRSDAVRVRYDLPRGREQSGSVWIGANPVKAAYVGKLSQRPDERGARAGRFFFEGGFIARLRSGHVGIFKRRGSRRLPIDEQAVTLLNTQEAVRAAQSFIPVRLQKTLAQEINFEVNVRGR